MSAKALPRPTIVVARAGQNLTQEAIISHCRQHLAGFKLPKAVVLVDSLPKNPSGKLLKRSLRTQHAALYSAAELLPART